MRAIVSALEATVQDVRYGARLLRRAPWFTLVAVASLAVGLGSGVGLFGFMNALLFRPLPGRDTADLQRLYTSNSDGQPYGSSSYADFQSFVSAAPPLFTASCATTNVRGNLVVGNLTQALHGALFSGGCFDALRLRPHVGRLLHPADESAGGGVSAIVISDTLWRRSFGSDPGVVGRAVRLNGAPAVIAGVAEPGFAGLSLDQGAEFWAPPPLAPALLSPEALTSRRERRFAVYVRLDRGMTAARAADRLAAVAARAADRLAAVAAGLRVEDPRAWTAASGSALTVTLASEVDSRFATSHGVAGEIAVSVLGGIAAIVAMACVNLATMVVARGAARSRELNLRLALGASRARLLRQLATESLLIGFAGGAAGLALVAGALRLFDAYRPAEIPAFNLAIDWRVVTFTGLMAFVAPVLFGLAPGAHALRLAIAEGLKGRTVAVQRRLLRVGPRELLLVTQVVVSFALLIMSTLFMRSLGDSTAQLQRATSPLVAVAFVDLNTASEADQRTLTERLVQAAVDLPQVERATAAAIVAMTGSSIGVAARPADRPDSPVLSLDANIVAPGYLELAGIRLRAGRTFDAGDRATAPRVAVVSESMARRLWETTAVIGRIVRLETHGLAEVVGVVADAPYRSLDGPQPVLYLPIAQLPTERWMLHARLRNGQGGEAMAALSRALQGVDARVIVGAAMPLSEHIDDSSIEARITEWVGGAAGTLQLALALMAIWGLVAYAVQRRTAEFAIRRALGATDASIVQLVMRPSLWLLATGGVIGCVAGALGAQVLHAEFPNLAPIDFSAIVPAAALFGLVVAGAAWLPARRATMIAPAAALKSSH